MAAGRTGAVASATVWMTWRAASIAVPVGYRAGWHWSNCSPKKFSSECAWARSRRIWR